jgi:hypothetical protein
MLTGVSDVSFLSPADGAGDEPDGALATPTPRGDGETKTEKDSGSLPVGDAGSAEAAVDAAYMGPLRAFVTDETWTGNLGGLTGADQKCAAAALVANLGGSGRWAAWLSTAKDDVRAVDRVTSDGPWQLVNGDVLATSKADLTDGDLQRPPRRTEKNVEINAVNDRVWTGTKPDGTSAQYDCALWTSGAGQSAGHVGEANNSGGNWSLAGPETCNNVNRLYCFELR